MCIATTMVGRMDLESRESPAQVSCHGNQFFLGTRMSTAWSAAHSFSVLFTLDSQPNPAQAFKHFTWYFSNNFEWRSAFQLFHLSLPLKRNSMRDWPFEARPFLKTTGTLYMLVHDAKTITRQCIYVNLNWWQWFEGVYFVHPVSHSSLIPRAATNLPQEVWVGMRHMNFNVQFSLEIFSAEGWVLILPGCNKIGNHCLSRSNHSIGVDDNGVRPGIVFFLLIKPLGLG